MCDSGLNQHSRSCIFDEFGGVTRFEIDRSRVRWARYRIFGVTVVGVLGDGAVSSEQSALRRPKLLQPKASIARRTATTKFSCAGFSRKLNVTSGKSTGMRRGQAGGFGWEIVRKSVAHRDRRRPRYDAATRSLCSRPCERRLHTHTHTHTHTQIPPPPHTRQPAADRPAQKGRSLLPVM